MAETWPAGLQQLLNVSNFSMKFGDTVIRSDMDVGLAKVRSRYTTGVDVYTCSVDMDIDDFTVLQTFYVTTLNHGVTTVAFDNPFTGDPDEFRFVGPPEISPMGGRSFKVNWTWERVP